MSIQIIRVLEVDELIFLLVKEANRLNEKRQEGGMLDARRIPWNGLGSFQ
jgi:hypothetical protein